MNTGKTLFAQLMDFLPDRRYGAVFGNELGRCEASPLGERRHATRPGDQPRRSSMDPGTAHPNDVALAALSA